MKPKGQSDGSWLTTSPERKLLRSDDGDFLEESEVDETTSDADEATVVNVPEYKNWEEEGVVTKVKKQWFCGA